MSETYADSVNRQCDAGTDHGRCANRATDGTRCIRHPETDERIEAAARVIRALWADGEGVKPATALINYLVDTLGARAFTHSERLAIVGRLYA